MSQRDKLRVVLPALLVLLLGSAPETLADTNWMAAVDVRLQESLGELAQTRREIADEKIPMAKTLTAAETAQTEARKSYEDAKRQLDRRNLDLGNLRGEMTSREQEKSYVGSLLGEFVRNFETRLHIVELTRYQALVEAARLAPENGNLKPAEVFAKQVALVEGSLERLEELCGGARFPGRAAGENGLVKNGTAVLLGPVAYFASDDGALGGIAEQRLGSLEPSVQPYADPAYVPMTRDFVVKGEGPMPFDPSLGSARKIEETQEGVVEHFLKGGTVMWPILAVALLAAFVALSKWIILSLVRMPGTKPFATLLEAVRRNDKPAAIRAAGALKGPAGAMLRAGTEYLDAPKDLIEEVMFETMLETRFRLNKALPLIAVSAACSPLLGLLGTVTGIIATFKLITVFGSGDVKMLSAGISEALITTEYGLYVAIPSILAHSFLSRKAKAIMDQMERLGIAFLTEIEKARSAPGGAP
jgi:biopolymer transport protein ExbB